MPRAATASLSAEPAGVDQIDATRRDYQVLSHVYVNGQAYAPAGDKVVSVALTEYEAEGLLAAGAVGPMPDQAGEN